VSFAMIVGLAGTALAAQNATDGGITPTLITGTSNNASLCSVQFPGTTELKVDAPTSGTYSDGTLTVTVTRPSTSTVGPSTSNSIDWAWVSGPTVVGVIVKDGVDGSNRYDYSSSNLTSDKYLTTPNNGAKGISNIKFCYGGGEPADEALPLIISKTAAGSYEKAYDWTIAKDLTSPSTVYTSAHTVTSNYRVKVTRDAGTVQNFVVAGTITVENKNDGAVTIDQPTDVLSDDTVCTVTGGALTVPANDSVTFDYECDLGDPTNIPSDLRNTAKVTWPADADVNGKVLAAGEDTDTVDVAFSQGDEIDECTDVSDSLKGPLGTVCENDLVYGEKVFTYSITHTVNPGCRDITNVAKSTTNDTGTEDTDDATVRICQVNKHGFTLGYWGNKNGQSDIGNFGTTTCNALKTSYPTVLSGLNCTSVTTFKSSVKSILDANASGTGEAMFKAQFLATALSVRKTAALGTTYVRVNGSLLGTGNCITVNQLLAAAEASYNTLKANKMNLLAVKDYFDQINNNMKVTCAP